MKDRLDVGTRETEKVVGRERVDGGAARIRDRGLALECRASLGHVGLTVPWDSQVGVSCRAVGVS